METLKKAKTNKKLIETQIFNERNNKTDMPKIEIKKSLSFKYIITIEGMIYNHELNKLIKKFNCYIGEDKKLKIF